MTEARAPYPRKSPPFRWRIEILRRVSIEEANPHTHNTSSAGHLAIELAEKLRCLLRRVFLAAERRGPRPPGILNRVPPLLGQTELRASLPTSLTPRAVMADLQDNLASLRGLYQDLSTNPNGSIATIERLCAELEMHIQDFRNLLDKAAKNNASRQQVLSGKCFPGLYNRCSLHGRILTFAATP